MPGQTAYRALISAVTKATQCQVTTTAAHGYSTGQYVRITDLDGMMPVPRGMVQIDDGLFLIFVDSTTTFLLRNPTTLEYINSTNFETYVSGGRTNLENFNFEYA